MSKVHWHSSSKRRNPSTFNDSVMGKCQGCSEHVLSRVFFWIGWIVWFLNHWASLSSLKLWTFKTWSPSHFTEVKGNTNTPSEETMWSVHQDLFYFPQDLYFPRVPVIVQFSSLPLARLLFAAGLVCRWNYVLGLAGTFSLIDCQIKWLKLYVIHICVYTMYNK